VPTVLPLVCPGHPCSAFPRSHAGFCTSRLRRQVVVPARQTALASPAPGTRPQPTPRGTADVRLVGASVLRSDHLGTSPDRTAVDCGRLWRLFSPWFCWWSHWAVRCAPGTKYAEANQFDCLARQARSARIALLARLLRRRSRDGKGCLLTPPQHSGARSGFDCLARQARSARIAVLPLSHWRSIPSACVSVHPRSPAAVRAM
jgi:hypothetical protein